MKKWLMLLLFMGGTTLSFAQYGPSSSGKQYNPYQSGSSSQYGQQQQQTQSGSLCDSFRNSDPEAYAFSQKLSPIHQAVFCQYFTRVQQKQAMVLAGSPTQGLKGEVGSITPDMAVEVVMQTARGIQGNQNNMQQKTPYQNPPQPYTYPGRGESGSRPGRYSNY